MGPTLVVIRWADEPLKLRCGAVLPNRLVKSALSEQLGDRRNAPTRELVELYRTWARGGAGALITGNVMVDPAALGEPRNVAATGGPAAFRAWARAAEGTDTRLWVQLNHPGRQSPRYLSREPDPRRARLSRVPVLLAADEPAHGLVGW